MKIKRIQIKNIGPYINENIFQFDVSDLTKRLALIGGKNGAGKTTLFNAIKICLYGCIAYGFESNNAKYYAEIEKIINTNEKLKKKVRQKLSLISCSTMESITIPILSQEHGKLPEPK